MAAATKRYVWPPWDMITGRKWTASGSGTGEFYVTTTGDAAIPALTKPPEVVMNGTARTEGTAGSLAAWEWDWADNDTLGFSTLYVRLGDDSDPDTQAANYVTAGGKDASGTAASEATAWATLKYGIADCTTGWTADTTNGDHFCIKVGATQSVTGGISFFNRGNGSFGAPIIVEGYVATVGDWSVGDDRAAFEFNASSGFVDTGYDHCYLINVDLADSPRMVDWDDYNGFFNCNFHPDQNGTVYAAVGVGGYNVFVGCTFSGGGGHSAIATSSYCLVYRCKFKQGPTYYWTQNAVYLSTFAMVIDCTFELSDSPDIHAIQCMDYSVIINNSINAPAGASHSAIAPRIQFTTGYHWAFLNNAIKGYGGTAGKGVDLAFDTGLTALALGGNSVQDATTVEVAASDKTIWTVHDASTETLGVSADPFADPDNDDFTPEDVGSLKQGSVPLSIGGDEGQRTYRWRGAVEPEEPAGGGGGGTTVPQGLHPIGDGITA